MKKTTTLFMALLFSVIIFAQKTTIPVSTQVKQIDINLLQKNQQVIIQNVRSSVTQKLAEYQSLKVKTDAALKAEQSSKISRFVANNLNTLKVDRPDLSIDPNMPVISNIYNPVPEGVKPLGLFLLYGYNLTPKTGQPEVTVKFGQTVLKCSVLNASTNRDWLSLMMADFGGILSATSATVSVKCDGLTSEPFAITLLPEIVVQELDFSKLTSQLQTDLKSTSTMIYATSISQLSMKHGYILLFPTTLGIYHFCPTATRGTIYQGTDEFFVTTKLKNGWVVESGVYHDNRSVCGTVPDGQTSTFFYGVKNNTPSLYVNIGWFNNLDLCFTSSCVLSYIIKGPKGTSPY